MTRRTFLAACSLLPAAHRPHFSTSVGTLTQPDAGCAPGFIIAVGSLTQDAQADTFAVGNGLALLPHPDTMAITRMEGLVGASVEVIIRPIQEPKVTIRHERDIRTPVR